MAAIPLPFPIDDGEQSDANASPSPAGSAGPAEPLTRLLGACAVLKELAGLDWTEHVSVDAKVAVQALEQISRCATAIQASVLSAAQTSGKWALDGQRTFDSWVSSQTGTTRGTAGRAVKLSKSLQEDLPGTRKALANGEISADHAQIISRRCTKTQNQRQRLSDPFQGEEYLLERAKQMDAGKFSKVAAAWAIETDPKAADRHWRQENAKHELVLTPADEGMHISGWLNPVRGAIVKEALAAHMGRKAKNDLRSFNERQADALVAIASQSLDAGFQMPNARIRPHLTITMEYDTIQRLVQASAPVMPPGDELAGGEGPGDEGLWAKQWRTGDDHVISTELDYSLLQGAAPATLADGTPIPPKVLARLACDSLLNRVIFGPQSTILNAGREQRIFTAHQTRAIIARDRTCQYPGCDEGPGFGEIHHSISWAKHQGNTDADLGILLCYHHHDLVHERDITITRRNGRWIFTTRHGNRLHPPDHQLKPGQSAPGEPPAGPDSPATGTSGPKNAQDTQDTQDTQVWQQPGFDTEGPPPF